MCNDYIGDATGTKKWTQFKVLLVLILAPCSPILSLIFFEEISTLRGLHRSLTEGCTLFPPNTKITNFNRQIIIFVHNFVPSNDESILSSCFFSLSVKWENPIRRRGDVIPCPWEVLSKIQSQQVRGC